MDDSKNIILVEPDEIASGYKYWKEAGQLAKSIVVCSDEYDLPEFQKLFYFYPQHPQRGDVYVRSPFRNDTFYEVSQFQDNVVKEKCHCLSKIASLLGASSFNASIEVESVKERGWDLNVGMKTIKVDGDFNLKRQEAERVTKKCLISDTYKKEQLTIQNYEKAIQLAKKYGLYGDPDVRGLLEKCNPMDCSMLSHEKVVCNLTSEVNSSLDLAFSINAMKGVFTIGANFVEHTKYRFEILEIMEYNFD